MGALYFNADNATNDDSIGDLPNLPVPISYPQYGGFTLLPLEGPNYTARVCIAPDAPSSKIDAVMLLFQAEFMQKRLGFLAFTINLHLQFFCSCYFEVPTRARELLLHGLSKT